MEQDDRIEVRRLILVALDVWLGWRAIQLPEDLEGGLRDFIENIPAMILTENPDLDLSNLRMQYF